MISIRELRTKANLPIRVVADAVNLPRSSFSYMERGLRKFPEGKERQVRDYLLALVSPIEPVPDLNEQIEAPPQTL